MIGIFLDSETNGLNQKVHRILEIAFKAIKLETGDVLDSFDALVYQPDDVWSNSDPRSLQVNGFKRELVDQGRREEDVATEIKSFFVKNSVLRGEAVYICQNPSFDRVFFSQLISPDEQEKLNWPYHWLDLASMYWGKMMTLGETYPWITGFSKDNIAKACNIPSEEAPHRAGRGVDHLIACYNAVIGFPGQGSSN
jgi:oligoribonuclease